MQQISSSRTSRPRPPRACTRCARRKLSCDKGRPRCSRCAREQAACEYAPDPPSGSQRTQMTIIDETPSIVAGQTGLQSRLDRLSQMIALQGTTGDRSTPDSNHASSSEENGGDAGRLSNGAQTKASYLSPTFFAMIRHELSEIENLSRDRKKQTAQRSTTKTSPRESSEPRKSPSEISTSSRPTESLLYGDLFPKVLDWLAPSDRGSPQQTGGKCLNDIVASLPLKYQQDMLIWAYMLGYHTITPLFHGPSFLQQIRDFQLWCDGLNPDFVLGAPFLSLYTAIMFAGCVVCERSRLVHAFGEISRDSLAKTLYDSAVAAIRVSGFPQSPSLQSLAAFVIVDTTWLRDEQPLSCCAFIGVAFRVAQMLGLHREPSNFKQLSHIDVQVRRHLWFTLVAIDAQVAFASGLPPIIENAVYNVQPISESNETLVPKASSRSANEDSILGVFVGGKYFFYCQTSEFLHILHKNTLTQDDLHKVLKIGDKIEKEMKSRQARIRILQEALPSRITTAEGDNAALAQMDLNPYFAQFAHLVFYMLAAKPYAIIYGPLRRHDLLPKLFKKKPDAIQKCRQYLHCFLNLAERRDFQPWHWCWPGQHQPLHSILALITEVERYPTDPQAAETRKLVDLALDMCRGEGNHGIVSNDDAADEGRRFQGGFEAWAFIRHARDTAWEKTGIDSSMLHCPSSVNEIHFEGSKEWSSRSSTSAPAESTFPMQFADALETNEDWAFLGSLTDFSWDLDGNVQHSHNFNANQPFP